MTRKHTCSVCGKLQPADRMVYSRFTRNRYCADIKACWRRARRSPATARSKGIPA